MPVVGERVRTTCQSNVRTVACYSRVYVSRRPRLDRIARYTLPGCSVPTAGDGEVGRAALPRGDQSRRRIHSGSFTRRRATSLPRDEALGQSWQARRRTDHTRESAISPERSAPSPPPPPPPRYRRKPRRRRRRVVVLVVAVADGNSGYDT